MEKQKTALILRWGAYGDHIQITPVIRAIKQDGYHVTVHTNARGLAIYKNNPYVDEIIQYKDDSIAHVDLEAYWKTLAAGYDKFVNLSGVVESGLLKPEGSIEYNWDKERRHRECNANYVEALLKKAGYPDADPQMELFPSNGDEARIKGYLKNKFKGKFIVLWSLSGSAFHKAYPWCEWVALKFLNRHEDAVIIKVGDAACMLLEWEHPRTSCMSDKWDIRTSILSTKYVNLVVGTETGILNAAGCFDTPKLVLLSHSTPENLTKHWRNVTPLNADVLCIFCHQLHYTRRSCRCDKVTGAPCCMAELDPKLVSNTIEKYYQNWKRNGKKSNG